MVAKIRLLRKKRNVERKTCRGEPKRKRRKTDSTTPDYTLPEELEQTTDNTLSITQQEKRKDIDVPKNQKLKQRRIGDYLPKITTI